MGKINNLEKLKAQKEQLDARIQKLEAAKKAREKKRETRRKILVGAYYLDKAKEEGTLDGLGRLMDSFLTRRPDRVLFGLDTEGEGEASTGNE